MRAICDEGVIFSGPFGRGNLPVVLALIFKSNECKKMPADVHQTMKFIRALLILVLLQSTTWLAQGQMNMTNHNTPVAVTQDLYDTAYQNFGPHPRNVKRVGPYLSPQLYDRLWYKVGQPPSGPQKDFFFCSETPPSDYSVGKADIKGNRARVNVKLTWGLGIKTDVGVLLKLNNGAWQVDDIDYGIFGRLSNYL